MKQFLFVAASSVLVLGACKSLDALPKSIPLGLFTISTSDAVSGAHKTSPSAYFVDAVNVSIPNSNQNADTCAVIGYPGTGAISPLAQIAAGTPVTVALTTDTAQLTPAAADVNGYVFYKLPAGDSIAIVPGSTGRVVVPGGTNAFHAFNFTFVNADSLKLGPIEASADSTHDMPITWNAQVGQHASVVVQLEYGTASNAIATQVFCQFSDNGSHTVQASFANAFRTANAQRVHAYRFLTTFNNDGGQEVGIVSTYSTDSTVVHH
ncbi:MAG: hypothetical protein ABIQ10_09680 [Gemmatimonadaceae bacterium]